MKKPTILFALFFTTSILLPATNIDSTIDSTKFIALGLSSLSSTSCKKFTTSEIKNVILLNQGSEKTMVYNQGQTILNDEIQIKISISRKNDFGFNQLFVKFSALNLGKSAKERTPT